MRYAPKSLSTLGSLALVAAFVGGCGADTPPATAGYDAGPVRADGAADGNIHPLQGDASLPLGDASPAIADADVPLGTCPPPAPAGTVPMVTGRVAQSSESPPAQTGGDPTGTWAAVSGVAYLPAAVSAFVYPDMSSVGGQAWFSFDGARYKFGLDVMATVATSIAGTQMVALADSSVGVYTVSGSNVTLTADCFESAPAADAGTGQGLMDSFEFTASGNTGQVLMYLPTDYGEVIVVVDLQKIG